MGYASGRSVAAVAFEATTGWRWVWRELTALGFDVCLADPGEVTALRGTSKRAKTDGSMLVGLVVLLAKELLPESWLPPAEIQELRDKTRLRKAIAEHRTRWAQRSLLDEGGLARAGAADGGGQTLGKPASRSRRRHASRSRRCCA